MDEAVGMLQLSLHVFLAGALLFSAICRLNLTTRRVRFWTVRLPYLLTAVAAFAVLIMPLYDPLPARWEGITLMAAFWLRMLDQSVHWSGKAPTETLR